MAENQSNISPNPKFATSGIVLDAITSQMPQGTLSWALNAVVESFDGKQITYSNEQANTACVVWPTGFRPIGLRNIVEESFIIAWLLNITTGDCQIGQVKNCTYYPIISATCLNFSLDFPILKHTHRNTNCGLEIYWVDGNNRARFVQLEKLPYEEIPNPAGCDFIQTTNIDCNKLNLQPNFSIPTITTVREDAGGSLTAGTIQFAAQYANALTEPYTSYYAIGNPIPIADTTQITPDFNYPVNKSISIHITDIDVTGVFDYLNLAVIKTVNGTSSVDLVATLQISKSDRDYTYSGEGTPIKHDILEIFQRYDTYTKQDDITTAQDVLILSGLRGEDRVSLQGIFNKTKVEWATIRLKGDDEPYKNPLNAEKYRGYMRDEVYALEAVVEMKNGHISDGFHIPGREAVPEDLFIIMNDDVPQNIDGSDCTTDQPLPRWKVYNTGTVLHSTEPTSVDECYRGEWQSGAMSYWESTELYPCNPIYGNLQGKPIRHHKLPDCLVTHIHDSDAFIYPIGFKVDLQAIVDAIKNSDDISQDFKDNIQAIRIVRGDRTTHSSISAKGLIHNVLKYDTTGNIIDATTGLVTSSSGNASQSIKNLLDTAYDFTAKGKKEFVTLYFITSPVSTLVPGPSIEQRDRYNDALRHIDVARNADPISSQENIDRLTNAITLLERIQDHSATDARGKAHSQAAEEILKGAIDVMKAQLELEAQLATIDPSVILTADATKFAYFPNYLFNDVRINPLTGEPSDFFLNNTIIDADSKQRWTLHSPDSSFFKPSLGDTLKLETAEHGTSSGHIVETKRHAKYQFISKIGYITAVLAGVTIGFSSGTYGVTAINVFNGQAAFTAYQTFLDILYKTVPHKNFAYQFNAVGVYNNFKPVPNNGNKQRSLDIATYLSPGMLNVKDKYTVNNYQRESSIYLRSRKPLPYTHEVAGVPVDASKLAAPTFDIINTPISSYYASLKNSIPNQYGQLYSYETIDTGFVRRIRINDINLGTAIVFGGDTFINRFAYKSKIPFFLDNRVNPNEAQLFADGSDISYNELSNVGRVKYWFSTDVTANSSVFSSFFATMTQHFFWPKIFELYLSGVVFLFAYGIPYFYCESAVNVDLRQAHNAKAGDFYPRVSSGIPDQWLQESEVTIQQDNSYYYNKTYSKQNKESVFTHLPPDYDFDACRTNFPFRTIFSEPQSDSPNPSNRNNWRIFKPSSRFDMPQNYGALISLDGIEDKAVLARFENKTLLYNALLTAPTSAADVYLGSSLFSKSVPPQDFADTDVGYVGCQHKLLLKTEFGHVSIDAKRGQVFLLQGTSAVDLTAKGISKFATEFFDFKITNFFPDVDIDNTFKGIGITGVYDTKYNRVILTKLDYAPINSAIVYKNGKFYIDRTVVELTDTAYFCSYSFSISYSFDTQSWTSFHSYLPNYYVPEANIFYSGNSESIWTHNEDVTKFNNFYGDIHPYILEYPYQYQYNDEILQNIKDYSTVLQYTDYREFIETDNLYFNKFIGFSNQQSTGLVELVVALKNNLAAKKGYPIYNTTSKTVLVTKSDSFYNLNTFWDMIKDPKKPVWLKDCTSLSNYKQLNQDNHDYGKRSFRKSPLRGKELKLRFILDDKDNIKIISQFTVAPTQTSYR